MGSEAGINPDMRRYSPLVSLTLASTLALGGCPGAIDEAMFLASRDGGGRPDIVEADGGGPMCPPDVRRDLVIARCATAGCHTTMDRVAALDLESDNLGSRLINVRASTTGSCANRMLVTINGATVDGVFFNKLTETPSCGLRMPLGARVMPLTEQEIECLRGYMRTLMAGTADGGTGMDASVPADSGRADARSSGG